MSARERSMKRGFVRLCAAAVMRRYPVQLAVLMESPLTANSVVSVAAEVVEGWKMEAAHYSPLAR